MLKKPFIGLTKPWLEYEQLLGKLPQPLAVTASDTVSVFVMPPSYEVLRERLERRSLDEGLVIKQRLKRACKEIRRYEEYDYLIVNRDLEDSIRELEAVISGSRCRRISRMESAKSVLATFGGMDAENP